MPQIWVSLLYLTTLYHLLHPCKFHSCSEMKSRTAEATALLKISQGRKPKIVTNLI